jgi:hypothetical protein
VGQPVDSVVSRWHVGDRVIGLPSGLGFAEQTVLDASKVFRIPNGMDWAPAAAFPIVHHTSHFALKDRAKLREGEWLLVHAGASGVAMSAIQLGRAFGARVIATAGSHEKSISPAVKAPRKLTIPLLRLIGIFCWGQEFIHGDQEIVHIAKRIFGQYSNFLHRVPLSSSENILLHGIQGEGLFLKRLPKLVSMWNADAENVTCWQCGSVMNLVLIPHCCASQLRSAPLSGPREA